MLIRALCTAEPHAKHRQGQSRGRGNFAPLLPGFEEPGAAVKVAVEQDVFSAAVRPACGGFDDEEPHFSDTFTEEGMGV